jgi:gliding motility-associated-like protein
MAPDEKIYYTRAGSEWLSVINNPNAIGTACNHVFDGVQLSPGTLSNEGLPPFLNGFFAPSYAILEGCAGQPSQFSIDEIGVCPGSSVVWDFGDPASGAANTSTDPNPVHTYNSAGTYNAVATITTPLNTYQAFRDIVIIDEPTLSGIQDLFACDNDRDGVELIDFSGNINAAFGGQSRSTYNVQVYGSQQDAEDDINRLPVQFSTDSGIFFIRIFGVNSRGCELIQPFEVTVNDEPDIFIDNRFECDEFNDGIELFDLDLIGLEALGANQNPVLFNYSFHRTRGQAESNSNPLPLAYQNTAPNETLFIRIEVNANQLCFNVAEFSINLQTEPEITGDLQIQLCDDVSRDNREQFDLLSLESQIRSMQPAGYTIDFFTNQSDAEANVNSISSDFTNSSPEQTVWVRLTNNADVVCSDVAPIELEVFERPTVEITGDAFKCIGDSIDLTATAGFVSYEWSTLEITPSITVTDPGTYSVTITDSNGCNDFTEFTVTDFEPTQITDIQVEEFTLRNNSIIVSVSGSGPFEYSLDNFTYQESNVFTGLIPGFYTVYVRDLNGCDLIEQDTEIIYGPPFFTPNGDTFNDRWQVTAIETEPDARIFIFDRFGKLLIQLSPLSAGWDGTFLGNPMPSTDYWYLVELADGKSFRGHFSLKR